MKLIAKLSDMIEDEIEDADKYIRCALNHKEDHPALASTFYQISTEELRHMNLLHDQVVSLINEYRKEHGDPPKEMQAIYDYLHEKHINRVNDIKVLQASYNK